jgi:hypothetical protein
MNNNYVLGVIDYLQTVISYQIDSTSRLAIYLFKKFTGADSTSHLHPQKESCQEDLKEEDSPHASLSLKIRCDYDGCFE